MTLATMTTLRLTNCLLVSLCILSFTILRTVRSTAFECHVEGCGCRFTNGSVTYEITMTDIKQKFKVLDGTTWTYNIDPCYDFTLTNCTDVTMCQSGGSRNFPIAKNEIKSFGPYVDKNTPIMVTYEEVTGPPEKTKRQMIINLKCGEKLVPPQSVLQHGSDPITYTLDITSKGACLSEVPPSPPGKSSSGRPSTGTILVIVFFMVLVVYLVAGILFMKYRRGATGKEVIPNVEFWSSLPRLIKDGCVFFGKKMKELCERCCQREGYSEI